MFGGVVVIRALVLGTMALGTVLGLSRFLLLRLVA
jgi:hypothetical protein